MPFNSLLFCLFLPALYLIFFFCADRWRWLLLLAASYGFYAALKAPYLLAVLLLVTALSYLCGLRISSEREDSGRKRWLWTGVLACTATLVLLKYFPFFESQGKALFGLTGTLSKDISTIGVSYFTFQAISYLADIYLEKTEAERHFGYYALSISFFPKLQQGPIERAGNLLPQLKQKYKFDYDAIRSGMLLFAWGLLKKAVVADRLAVYADQVYGNLPQYSGLALVIGTYAYALQIYFDFSGYTDMARGTGRIFGIALTENFNSPYLATSIGEFWRRWHISFSSWILDYIFKPLQMQWRHWGQAGSVLALLVTFLVSGIWHGASWGFVIWGFLHGLYMAVSLLYRPYQEKLAGRLGMGKSRIWKYWKVFLTFNLVSFAWVFFRAHSIGDALYVITHVFRSGGHMQDLLSIVSGENGRRYHFVTGAIVLSMVIADCKRSSLLDSILRSKGRWAIYYSLALLILIFYVFTTSGFVYGKF